MRRLMHGQSLRRWRSLSVAIFTWSVMTPALLQGQTPWSAPVVAQGPNTPHNVKYVENPADNAAADAQDSISGLQWMQPRVRDVSHYTVPMCLRGIQWLDHLTRTRATHDTTVPGSKADTLSTTAKAFGTSCAERWTVASVPSMYLPEFIQLSLAIGDDRKADAAIERSLREASNDSAKAGLLLNIMDAARNTHPVRRDLIDTTFARINALHARMPVWRVIAQQQYIRTVREMSFDTTRTAAAATSYLANVRALTPDELKFVPEPLYTKSRLETDIFARLPADTTAIRYARGWQQEYEILRMRMKDTTLETSLIFGAKTMPQTRASTMQGWFMYRQLMNVGKPVEAKVSDGFWFAEPGDTTPTTIPMRPKPGRVTLVAQLNRIDASVDFEKAMIRRLYDRYTKDGLDIILVNNTIGYAWKSPPLEPKDEARVVAWYVHDVCDLPVPLVVLNTPTRSAADGSRELLIDSLKVFGKSFGSYGNWALPVPPTVLVIDREGREYATQLTDWLAVEASVRQALGLSLEVPR